jgi:hypothetical protein
MAWCSVKNKHRDNLAFAFTFHSYNSTLRRHFNSSALDRDSIQTAEITICLGIISEQLRNYYEYLKFPAGSQNSCQGHQVACGHMVGDSE